MAKKDKIEEMQKAFDAARHEMTELRSKIDLKYTSFMFWATSGLAGGFFLILIAIAINYFFGNTPPSP